MSFPHEISTGSRKDKTVHNYPYQGRSFLECFDNVGLCDRMASGL